MNAKITKPTLSQLKNLRNAMADADDDVLGEPAPEAFKPMITRTSPAFAAALKDPIGQLSEALPVQRPAVMAVSESVSVYSVGQVYDFPFTMVRESKYNARVYYRIDELDEMSASLSQQGQLVPARGYLKNGHVYLIDGQKRFRAATASGLQSFRVEVCAEPKDSISHYLQSREINLNRSEQTALDDAVRFQEFLDAGLAATHEELAKLMGMSQPKMTKTLAINKIPEPVLRRMREIQVLTRLGAANAISQFFSDRVREQGRALLERDPDGRSVDDLLADAANDVIDEAARKDLSGNQIDEMVKDRCDKMFREVQHRPRSESRPFVFGGVKGSLKTFETAGRLDLSIKGLSPDKLRELREAVEKVCGERS